MKKLFHMSSFGIEFDHKGDNVLWLWPWKRPTDNTWFSFGFNYEFPSLEAIDKEWEGYFKLEMERFEKEEHHPWCNVFNKPREGCWMCEDLYKNYPLLPGGTGAMMATYFPKNVRVR